MSFCSADTDVTQPVNSSNNNDVTNRTNTTAGTLML